MRRNLRWRWSTTGARDRDQNGPGKQYRDPVRADPPAKGQRCFQLPVIEWWRNLALQQGGKVCLSREEPIAPIIKATWTNGSALAAARASEFVSEITGKVLSGFASWTFCGRD